VAASATSRTSAAESRIESVDYLPCRPGTLIQAENRQIDLQSVYDEPCKHKQSSEVNQLITLNYCNARR